MIYYPLRIAFDNRIKLELILDDTFQKSKKRHSVHSFQRKNEQAASNSFIHGFKVEKNFKILFHCKGKG
ncbi:hypothetical protein DQM68_00855 [Leptospira mayottensis]|uniref:Uncharacterized protein n=2 Tax=Leptospira mayottensis TaxID=1137606 RepID=A0AA87MM05_9LEPT|nr:hypothetical protein DQM68_00855 [Leptospira mayottensis]AZQ01203.1 hypothetical protein LEP1GSC190_03130 [Leptospira mayottensis 200901116]EKR98180.1 hypothetical protein LEP1GSC125_1109 [Leptospira mayottensis 200901122]AXR63260.1 hypothetical protein DQM28_02475 [Leptospira mayottensis]AXR67025.1 hypothetical protein DPV73_02360 [Leptospira mayottensis]